VSLRKETSVEASLQQAWRSAWASGVPQRSLLVALVVGTLLNLINQGEALFAGQAIHWGRAILTYIVPFIVSTHGALSARKG
jgi:hypothetical protein